VREAGFRGLCKNFFSLVQIHHTHALARHRARSVRAFSFSIFSFSKIFHMQKALVSSAFSEFSKFVAQTRSCNSQVQARAGFASARSANTARFDARERRHSASVSVFFVVLV
jgi:hypothetical protein